MTGIANCGCHTKDTGAPEQVLQGRQVPKPTPRPACHWGGHNVAVVGGRRKKWQALGFVGMSCKDGGECLLEGWSGKRVLIAGVEADVVTAVWMLSCDGEGAGIQICLPCAGSSSVLAVGGLMQLSRKNTEQLTADERRVKNKCEKLDHGTWHLEMKQDFSGRL